MSDSTLYTILGIGAAVALSAVLSVFQWRKLREQWEGTVTKIQAYSETDNNDSEEGYVKVSYRLDDGSVRTLRLREYDFQQRFPALRIGERLVKAPGAPLPKRVPSPRL